MAGLFDKSDIDHTKVWLIVDGERQCQILLSESQLHFDEAVSNCPGKIVEVREERHIVESRTVLTHEPEDGQ